MNESPTPENDPSLPAATPSESPSFAEARELLHLHMPVDVRSASLVVLACLALIFTLHWASAVLIPVTLGLTFSYALTPIVDWLERQHIPRAAGAALLMTAIVGSVGWTAYAISDDAVALLESLPEATQKVRESVRAHRSQSETTIGKVQRAATQLEQAAQESAPPVATRGVQRVRIERAQFDIKDYLWTGTMGLAASIGQAVIVLFITFFLLASGDMFRRKIVRITGSSFANKRITVQALDEITGQIQRFLLVQVFTSAVVGLVIWISFMAIGLEHAAVWGIVAFALDFIPYIGAVTLTAGSALVAFVQFGSLDMPLLVGGVALLVHTLSGNLLSPWLMSRAARMNPVAVFVGVLLFGWLWGVWGLLLGVPILTTVKTICDRVDDLNWIGELLGQ